MGWGIVETVLAAFGVRTRSSNGTTDEVKTRLMELPFSDPAITSGPDFRTEGGGASLLARYYDENRQMERPFQLHFDRVRAFRKRADGHCTAWHISDCYEVLCEVQDSVWIRELREAQSPPRYPWVLRHFILYIEEIGCLEIMAESFSVITDEVGTAA